jgi:hypothetical protein
MNCSHFLKQPNLTLKTRPKQQSPISFQAPRCCSLLNVKAEFDGVTNIISKLTFETELNIYFLVSPFIFCAFEHDEAGLSIKR